MTRRPGLAGLAQLFDAFELAPRPLPAVGPDGIQHAPVNFPRSLQRPEVRYDLDLPFDPAYDSPPPPGSPGYGYTAPAMPIATDGGVQTTNAFGGAPVGWSYIPVADIGKYTGFGGSPIAGFGSGMVPVVDAGGNTVGYYAPPKYDPTHPDRRKILSKGLSGLDADDAATAASEQAAASSYIKTLNLLRSGSFYDYGAGSSRRNAFYQKEGMGASMNLGDSFDDDGLSDLGLDFFSAIQAAVKDKAVAAEFSKITSPFASTDPASGEAVVGGMKIPGGVSALFSGLFKAGSAAASNLQAQSKAAPVPAGKVTPSAGGASTASKAAAVTAMSPATLIALVVIVGLGGYAVMRNK